MQPDFPGNIFIQSNDAEESKKPARKSPPLAQEQDRVSQMGRERISLAGTQTMDSPPVLTGPRKITDWVVLGNTFLKNHEIEQALDAFSHALELNPNSLIAKEGLIKVYYHAQDFATAIKIYEEISKKTEDTSLLILIAVAYYKTAKINQAIEICQKMLKYKKSGKETIHFTAYKVMSDCHLLRGEYQLAIDTALKYLYINPHSHLMEQHLADCYYQSQDYKLCIIACHDCLKSDPLNLKILETLAKSQIALDLYKDALNTLNSILKIQNSENVKLQFSADKLKLFFGGIRYQLGICLLHLGDLEKGHNEYLKAFEITQEKPPAWRTAQFIRDVDLCRKLLTAAEYHACNGRLQQSIEIYTDILTKNPGNITVLESRAFIYMRMDTLESNAKSIDDLTEILKQRPDWSKIICNRAELYHTLDRFEEAVVDYERLAKLEPANQVFYFHYAVSCYKVDKYRDRALQLFSLVIDKPVSESDLLVSWILRGSIFFSKDKLHEALDDLSKANKLYNSNVSKFSSCNGFLQQLYFNLSIIHKRLNNHNKASEFALKAMKALGFEASILDPESEINSLKEVKKVEKPKEKKVLIVSAEQNSEISTSPAIPKKYSLNEPKKENQKLKKSKAPIVSAEQASEISVSSAIPKAPSAPKDHKEEEAIHKMNKEKQAEADYKLAVQESKERELKRQEERKQRKLLAKQKEAQQLIELERQREHERKVKKFEVNLLTNVKAGLSKKKNGVAKNARQNLCNTVPDWWTDTEKTKELYNQMIPAKPKNDTEPQVQVALFWGKGNKSIGKRNFLSENRLLCRIQTCSFCL